MVAPGLAAPYHQHLFNVRLDMEVDGPDNAVYEVDAVRLAARRRTIPWGNAFGTTATLLETELAARARRRPGARAGSGRSPTAVEAQRRWDSPRPTSSSRRRRRRCWPTPTSSVGQRAAFAAHNLWVTPFAEDERRAAGDYPNQHAGGAGLPAWTAQDRAIVDTDVVLWHSFGVTHIPRPEDWPVMPVEYTGFSLRSRRLLRPQPRTRRAADRRGRRSHCHGD